MKKATDIFGRRVYTYMDDEGTVYWSFTKHPSMITPPRRLYLQSRIGRHVINFLANLREKAQALMRGDG